jgi:hypothetical protein
VISEKREFLELFLTLCKETILCNLASAKFAYWVSDKTHIIGKSVITGLRVSHPAKFSRHLKILHLLPIEFLTLVRKEKVT